MNYLPDDILLMEIMTQVSLEDIVELCKVDKRFNNLCKSRKLWEILYEKEFHTPLPNNLVTIKDIKSYIEEQWKSKRCKICRSLNTVTREKLARNSDQVIFLKKHCIDCGAKSLRNY